MIELQLIHAEFYMVLNLLNLRNLLKVDPFEAPLVKLIKGFFLFGTKPIVSYCNHSNKGLHHRYERACHICILIHENDFGLVSKIV